MEISMLDASIIYGAGVVSSPLVRATMRAYELVGHTASIYTFASTNPKVAKFISLIVLAIALVLLSAGMSGCSTNALTPNSDGDIDAGPFVTICGDERRDKVEAFRELIRCADATNSIILDLNHPSCSRQRERYNLEISEYSSCMVDLRPSVFTLNPNISY